MNCPATSNGGFTVLELLVAMGLACLLGLLAMPSLVPVVGANQLSAQVSTFVDDLRFARSEALMRNASVTMCRATDAQAASPICAQANLPGGWEGGWIIFVDQDGNGTRTPTEPLLRVQQAFAGSGGIQKESAGRAVASYVALRFRPSGLLVGMEATVAFNPPASLRRPELKRQVVINATGRVRIVGEGGFI
jgi:type IV fimbrial biogenesis protein FimT